MDSISDYNKEMKDKHFKKKMNREIYWKTLARTVDRYLMDRIVSEKGKKTEWEYIQFLQQELDHVELWLKEKLQDEENDR